MLDCQYFWLSGQLLEIPSAYVKFFDPCGLLPFSYWASYLRIKQAVIKLSTCQLSMYLAFNAMSTTDF